MRFRACLAASLAIHGLAAAVLGTGLSIRERIADEMVIDLTGSFRTRVKAGVRPAPAETTASVAATSPRTQETAASGEARADGGEGGNASVPLYRITSLPEIKDRAQLREKLARYYPQQARDQGIEGVVLLEVVVSSSGRISKANVVSAEPGLFADAAVKVCHELAFVPAYLGTSPVAVRIRLPIRFQITP
jgi:TonB family protein